MENSWRRKNNLSSTLYIFWEKISKQKWAAEEKSNPMALSLLVGRMEWFTHPGLQQNRSRVGLSPVTNIFCNLENIIISSTAFQPVNAQMLEKKTKFWDRLRLRGQDSLLQFFQMEPGGKELVKLSLSCAQRFPKVFSLSLLKAVSLGQSWGSFLC